MFPDTSTNLIIAMPRQYKCRRLEVGCQKQQTFGILAVRGHQPFWNWELLFGADLREGLPVWHTLLK